MAIPGLIIDGNTLMRGELPDPASGVVRSAHFEKRTPRMTFLDGVGFDPVPFTNLGFRYVFGAAIESDFTSKTAVCAFQGGPVTEANALVLQQHRRRGGAFFATFLREGNWGASGTIAVNPFGIWAPDVAVVDIFRPAPFGTYFSSQMALYEGTNASIVEARIGVVGLSGQLIPDLTELHTARPAVNETTLVVANYQGTPGQTWIPLTSSERGCLRVEIPAFGGRTQDGARNCRIAGTNAAGGSLLFKEMMAWVVGDIQQGLPALS